MFQILVVEDDKIARKLMKTVLMQYGYQPILATDGMEALQLMETHHIDLVLLDLMMPNMDGYTLTDTLSAREFSELFNIDYEVSELLYMAYAINDENYAKIINGFSVCGYFKNTCAVIVSVRKCHNKPVIPAGRKTVCRKIK